MLKNKIVSTKKMHFLAKFFISFAQIIQRLEINSNRKMWIRKGKWKFEWKLKQLLIYQKGKRSPKSYAKNRAVKIDLFDKFRKKLALQESN